MSRVVVISPHEYIKIFESGETRYRDYDIYIVRTETVYWQNVYGRPHSYSNFYGDFRIRLRTKNDYLLIDNKTPRECIPTK